MSSGFISEAEIEEHRRVRQKEWEKVRKPDEPLQAPEEEYDNRTLFERLEEQRMKRDLEYEETHKLKNMVKGLDDDEVDFLEMVDRSKLAEERKLYIEEKNEIRQFRNRVASLEEESINKRIIEEVVPIISSMKSTTTSSSKTSQKKLLAGAVLKKQPNDTTSKPLNKLKPELRSESSVTEKVVHCSSDGSVNPNKVHLPANDEKSTNSSACKKRKLNE